MNDFILTGIIKNDLVLKKAKEGAEYCAISLEADPRFKDKKTSPFLIMCWQNIATGVCKDLQKGDYVKLEGYIKPTKTKNGDDSIGLVLFSYRLFKHNNEIQKDFVYEGENKIVDLVINNELKEESEQDQEDTVEECNEIKDEIINPFDSDLTY